MFYFIQNGGKLKRNVSADIDQRTVDYSSRNNIFRLNITLKLDSGVVGFLMRIGSSLFGFSITRLILLYQPLLTSVHTGPRNAYLKFKINTTVWPIILWTKMQFF